MTARPSDYATFVRSRLGEMASAALSADDAAAVRWVDAVGELVHRSEEVLRVHSRDASDDGPAAAADTALLLLAEVWSGHPDFPSW